MFNYYTAINPEEKQGSVHVHSVTPKGFEFKVGLFGLAARLKFRI